MGSRMSTVSRKNATVKNFAQSYVLIEFSCTVPKIQNTGHSQRISPCEVVEHGLRKNTTVKLCAKSRFNRFSVHRLENLKY
ncbi:hypothetical protein B296_00007069 [Ensete ventricosum]|uniref:Uncharacterized protein n=1 Tax=Ensete ventricosum TaxID=4639 RepID=A0A426ZC39_ENSVE|nr:hypothetical protein B296_00007069 [Ensete ventricosum]